MFPHKSDRKREAESNQVRVYSNLKYIRNEVHWAEKGFMLEK